MSLRIQNPPTDMEGLLDSLVRDRISERIFARDHRVWKPDPAGITDRLGWLALHETMRPEISRLVGFAERLRARGVTDVMLLGMGGSSLAPQTFATVFGPAPGCPRLHVLDSTHPDEIRPWFDRLSPQSTVVLVSTKSGTTIETMALLRAFYRWTLDALGPDAGNRFAAVTDPSSPLADLASKHGFSELFLNDPTVGGRFSALSLFGLVPAALLGIDIGRLLDSAARAAARAVEPDGIPMQLGAFLGQCVRVGRDKATLILPERFAAFGDWVEQLLAESTGKQGTGLLPIVGEPLGDVFDYAEDRLFVSFRPDPHPEHSRSLRALEADGHPSAILEWDDPYEIGAQVFLWEFATAVAGHVLGIQPFDQPNVEAAKRAARDRMTSFQRSGKHPSIDAPRLSPQAFWSEIDPASPPDYVALQVYAPRTENLQAALEALRVEARSRTGCAVTIGYGPRFLHSTGQLHKGDRGNGRFIQLIAPPQRDLEVPDGLGSDESLFEFSTLLIAQALGDRDALRGAARRVRAFDLGNSPEDAVSNLLESN